MNCRKPEYLSPSSLGCYRNSPEEFYIRYLCPVKAPKIPQTQPMSVGSAFDAFAKSYLHEALFGKGNPKYELASLFEAQVESQNRDQAWKDGEYTFREYKESGALADMMLELKKAINEPRFEFDIKGVIEGYREGVTKKSMGVPLFGKPDILFINEEGAHVIWDFKVNGFYGRQNLSPMPGYSMLRAKEYGSWVRKGSHKDALMGLFKGMRVNMGSYLEYYNYDWALQLATYGWLMGESVGTEMITAIDQIVANGIKRDTANFPELRIATHLTRVSEGFQFRAMAEYQVLWGVLTEEPFYFFRDLSFEESALKCETLNKSIESMVNADQDSDAAWVYGLARQQTPYKQRTVI